MPDGRRVVLLGLDAGNRDLIRRWSADGSLPNLRRLEERGLAGDVDGCAVAEIAGR